MVILAILVILVNMVNIVNMVILVIMVNMVNMVTRLTNFIIVIMDSAAQSVTHRCMGKTCGFAAVLAATAAQQPDLVGEIQSRKSTAKQSEK